MELIYFTLAHLKFSVYAQHYSFFFKNMCCLELDCIQFWTKPNFSSTFYQPLDRV